MVLLPVATYVQRVSQPHKEYRDDIKVCKSMTPR